ncbi:MAG: RNA polymerase sigma factor [Bacteroidota bacterium]
MPESIHTLIKNVKAGNEKAMLKVYDRYCEGMFIVASRYLSTEEAKDAMQEGFLKAFTKIESYKSHSTFGSWLKRIIINQCVDELKKNRLELSEIETEHLSIEDDNYWSVDTRLNKADVLMAIENMKENHRVILNLYLIEGYDHQEISEILNIPVKTSRTRLRRGRLQLKEQLKQKYNAAGY